MAKMPPPGCAPDGEQERSAFTSATGIGDQLLAVRLFVNKYVALNHEWKIA